MITPVNEDEWINTALENTTQQLIAIVANHNRSRAQQAIGHKQPHALTKMTFRVHAGQGAIKLRSIRRRPAPARRSPPSPWRAFARTICPARRSTRRLRRWASTLA